MAEEDDALGDGYEAENGNVANDDTDKREETEGAKGTRLKTRHH